MGCNNQLNSCLNAYDNTTYTGQGIPGVNAKQQFLSIEVDAYNVELTTAIVPIVYTTELAKRGNDIVANLPTSDVLLKANRAYIIGYTVDGEVINSPATLRALLYVDGIALEGSSLSATKTTGRLSVSYTSIYETGATDVVLSVRANGPIGTPRIINSVLNVIEIAQIL